MAGPSPAMTGLGIASMLAVLIFAVAALAQAPQPFPALTGRVVDAANLLPPDRREALEAKLKAHEDKTTDQIVVATVPSLGGGAVEDYANRLFRAWKLGEKAKNNGVLFLVAPTERKVRIEVGYGLEGSLTDAISSVIIRSAVAPRFKAGDFAGGIDAGVDAVIGTLTGDDEWQRRARVRSDPQSEVDWVTIAILFVIFAILISRFFRSRPGGTRYHRSRGGSWVAVPIPSGGGWSGSFGGGGFGGGGGGFSGGGGSSGGGGASGSW